LKIETGLPKIRISTNFALIFAFNFFICYQYFLSSLPLSHSKENAGLNKSQQFAFKLVVEGKLKPSFPK